MRKCRPGYRCHGNKCKACPAGTYQVTMVTYVFGLLGAQFCKFMTFKKGFIIINARNYKSVINHCPLGNAPVVYRHLYFYYCLYFPNPVIPLGCLAVSSLKLREQPTSLSFGISSL